MSVRAARIVALSGLVAGVLLIFYVAFHSGGTYTVRAVFETTRGLVKGGEVKAAGLRVGKVTDITLGDNGLPLVTMEVHDDYVLRRGATADLRLASAAGALNRFIELERGDGPKLEEGATLGPSATDQPVDLDRALAAFTPHARSEVAGILRDVDYSLRGRGKAIDETLHHSAEALNETAQLLGEVNRDRIAIRDLVSGSEEIVSTLAPARGELGSTAERLALALHVAAGRSTELRKATREFGPAMRAGRGTLEALRHAIPNLRRLVHAANPAAAELLPLSRELPDAVDSLRSLVKATDFVRSLPGNLRRISPILAAATPILRHIGPSLRRLNPVLDHLRARAPELVSFFTLGGDVTSNYDINGNMVRSDAIFIPTQTNTDAIGPGEPGPGSLIRPFDRLPGVLEGEAWRNYARSFIGGGRDSRSYGGGGG